MILDNNSKYTRKTIQGFIEMQEDILKIPDLSGKQIGDIQKLRQGLNALSLESNDAKIKLGLVDFMNSMN
jgi:hypothetical protein